MTQLTRLVLPPVWVWVRVGFVVDEGMPEREVMECRIWAVVKVLVLLGRSCDVDCTMMNSSLRWARLTLLQAKKSWSIE